MEREKSAEVDIFEQYNQKRKSLAEKRLEKGIDKEIEDMKNTEGDENNPAMLD